MNQKHCLIFGSQFDLPAHQNRHAAAQDTFTNSRLACNHDPPPVFVALKYANHDTSSDNKLSANLCSSVHICVHLWFTSRRLKRLRVGGQGTAAMEVYEKELNTDAHRFAQMNTDRRVMIRAP
jgi:hypothetical protein